MDWFRRPSPLQDGFEWFRVTGTRARMQVDMLREQIARRARQVACAEFLDAQMADLLRCFVARGRPTTVVVTADHGECLGEQGLYGHAIHHEKVLEVPLLIFRLNAPPHAAPETRRHSMPSQAA